MAVVPPARLHWNGSTGSVIRDPRGAEYTAVWRVTTNDPLDQSQTVLVYFQANEIALGSVYNYANDTGVSVATADRIRAKRLLGHSTEWDVTVSYSTPSDQEGEDEAGVQQTDPVLWRPDISSSTVHYTETCEKAKYFGGYGAGLGEDRIGGVGNITIPMNSVGVPFLPGLEKDVAHLQVRIQRNRATFDSDEADENTNVVNILQFSINKFGFTGTFPDYTAKIRDWDAHLRRVNGIDFWEASVVIERNNATWRQEIADRGVAVSGRAGDPDGRGGFISALDLINGVPRLRRLLDADEQPIDAVVLLDGKGQMLNQDVDPLVPVYGKWLCDGEQDFPAIPFLQGIVD